MNWFSNFFLCTQKILNNTQIGRVSINKTIINNYFLVNNSQISQSAGPTRKKPPLKKYVVLILLFLYEQCLELKN